MGSFLSDVRDMLVPVKGSPHGPLAPLLVAMTCVTGLVDAFSYLVLGHVFVANMTGNILFLAFALVGEHGLSVAASLVALGTFLIGAATGGKLISTMKDHRGQLLAVSSSIQAVFLALAVVFAVLSSTPLQGWYRYALIIALALAMGIQNAASRKLAVPDLTTTVLTLTITGIGADSALVGGSGSKSGRRLVAVASMLLGALVGGALVLHVRSFIPLVLALVIVVSVAVSIAIAGSSNPEWT
ncbi:MAG TPA: YoaK family protein [Acidimicrobiales bacterium]|jgi:uncharacterized membrane protein YoaK (UPF0700 family)|nr:YoaK family protein [Acidimicrobiales bacterium]